MDKGLQESPVRVMSFNVRGSFHDVRKRNAWRNRAELSFLHLNTHLDHVSALARREGSKLIVSRVVEISDRTGVDPPAIVTGDFNSRPGNRTHKTFTGSGFADTYLAAGNEEGANTFHAFRGAGYRDAHPHRGPRRIDWIFLKDAQGRLRVGSHRIIHDADESSGLYPSDHYPILADFSWSMGG